ncbi:MAG: lipid-A-disaccharide synthase [Saprospiraceae bacterium]
MKYYLIAGEASGDLHGSNLIKALKEQDSAADFQFWGGDLMAKSCGTNPVKHYKDLAFMGFIEVVSNLKTILKNLKFCKADILRFQPDALILIDYPGFNLRIAKWAKQQGIKVLFYISPQVWAWKAKRVHAIKRDVDQLYTILPFEADFYKKYDYEVEFVGHPLLDVISNEQQVPPLSIKNTKPIVALLPGSRKQEISKMLPVMLTMTTKFPDYQFIIGGAPAMPNSFYEKIITQNKAGDNIQILHGETYPLMKQATAALVTSGTATLETALFDTPEVVCYKGSPISYWIAKRLVKIKYISLVNLIVDKPLVKELIQGAFNPQTLRKELSKILKGTDRERVKTGYRELRKRLGNNGASSRAAQRMIAFLKQEG